MALSKNEAMLLAYGYTNTDKDISIKLNEYEILTNLKSKEIGRIYLIADMEEAIKLYKKYRKSFRKKLKVFNDEFIENCLIIQEINKLDKK